MGSIFSSHAGTTSAVFETRQFVFAVIVLIIFGSIKYMPSGPFKKPHPLFWKVLFSIHFVYVILALILLLTENTEKAHNFKLFFFPELDSPISEKSHSEDCRLYTPSHPDGSFHNLLVVMDFFVPAHIIGWIVKGLIFQDYIMLLTLSIGFEFLEYTLEPQLPNFGECWWDHWILDALLCNGIGMWLGVRLASYLKLKQYHWTTLWKTQTHGYQSLLRYICICFLLILVLLDDLVLFYLKSIFWIPSDHKFIYVRRIIHAFSWACTVREIYEYFSSTISKKWYNCCFSWLLLTSLVFESCAVIKFGWDVISIPLHTSAYVGWGTGLLLLSLWIFWNFFHQIKHNN